MTRSKIEFATILASMRGQGEDPKQLAEGTTLRKLCYEIEKIEQQKEAEAEVKVPEPPKNKLKARPFWSFMLGDSSDEDS